MKWILCAVTISVLTYMAPVNAETDSAEFEVGATHDRLSNRSPDWTSIYVDGKKKLGDDKTLYGTLRETRRFGLTDQEARGGYYFPLAENWTGLFEANASSTHNVLPKWSALGEIIHNFGGGWVGHLGLRETEYNSSTSTRKMLTVERYWGNFRAAYTFSASQTSSGGSPSGSRINVNYYYGDGSSIGLGHGRGKEIESIGPDALLISNVRSVTLTGRHWFNPAWALTYDWGTHEQGTSYTRDGFSLGLRHRF